MGAFLAALTTGAPPVAAARFANAAAALSTTRPGPAAAPELPEIRALLAQGEAASMHSDNNKGKETTR